MEDLNSSRPNNNLNHHIDTAHKTENMELETENQPPTNDRKRKKTPDDGVIPAKTFRKRTGTTNLGRVYEDMVRAKLMLQLATDNSINTFKLSSDDAAFGLFDEIVLEVETDNREEKKYALQLKHVNNNGKTLSLDDIKKPNTNKNLYSVQKYFDSFKKIKIPGYTFILCTTLKFSVEDNTEIQLLHENLRVKVTKCQPLEVINFSEASGACYKFEIVENVVENGVENVVGSDKNIPEEIMTEYKSFFDHFFMYTSQDNFKQIKSSIVEIFQKRFFCQTGSECEKYLQFVTDWSLLEGSKEKLEKMTIQRVIALALFTPFLKPLRPLGFVSAQMKLFRNAIAAFDVTVFKEEAYENLSKLWSDVKVEFTDLQEINEIIVRYKLALKEMKEIECIDKLDDEVFSKLLWLMGKCPLIVNEHQITRKAVELCQNKNIILLREGEVEQQMPNVSIFQNLQDLKSKSELYEDILGTMICSIQGKKVKLKRLIERNPEFQTNITTNDLLKMSNDSFQIGEEKEEISSPYINRHLSANLVHVKYFEKIDNSILVVLNCMNNIDKIKAVTGNFNLNNVAIYLRDEEVKDKTKEYKKKKSNAKYISLFHTSPVLKHFVSGPDLYVSDNECSQEEFERVCNKNPQATQFHHLRIIDENTLEWIRSKGDISDLEQYRVENHLTEETSLYKIPENNINLIIGDPGMGKSELLKNIKNNCSADYWVIFLYSQDITLLCTQLGEDEDHLHELKTFILNKKYGSYSEFDKKCLEILMENNQVVYLWDALDEVSAKNLDTIITLIQKLATRSLFQWVTSRCHLKKILEKKLSVLSRNISQFNEDDQKNYIQKRLDDHQYSREDVEEVTNKIISTITLMKDNDVLGVPLQIFMLTELFRQDQNKYFNLLNDVFSLTDLYHHIVEEKFNIYYQQKANVRSPNPILMQILEGHKKVMREKYGKAALKSLVTKEVFKHLNINCEDFLNEIQGQNDSIGLITEVTDNFPQFLHNSYAEYFVASYFIEHYHDENERRKIDTILFDNKYTNIRFFFDLLQAEGSSACVAVLYKNIDLLKQCNKGELMNCQDAGGRNVIELACSWGKKYPILRLQNCSAAGTYVIDNEADDSNMGETEKYKKILQYLIEKFNDSSLRNALAFADRTESLVAAMTLMIMQKRRNELTPSPKNDDRGISILYYSAKFGYDEVLDLYDTLPFIKTSKDNFSLIHLAVTYGHENYLQKLLARNEYKIFIDDRDKFGKTGLHKACETGSFSIVKLLVDSGAKLHPRTNSGSTPLHAACLRAHEEIVKFLLKSKASINIVKGHRITPLHVTCWNGHAEVAKLLIEAGANINVAAEDGCTPLYVASRNRHYKVVELLLTLGTKLDSNPININLAQKDGVTPLFVACQEGHIKNVELLIKFKADIHKVTKTGESPLYIACQNGHEKVVDMLIKAGAKINTTASNGWTPLHVACQQGYRSVVRILIDAGAKVSIDKKDITSPLSFARNYEHKEIVQLLENSVKNCNC